MFGPSNLSQTLSTFPTYWGFYDGAINSGTAFGSLGIGLCIASLARTQRLASLGALCYMLVVALLLLICQQTGIGFLPWVFLEYHGPRMIHAALQGPGGTAPWRSLAATAALAVAWTSAAAILFRRYGWQ